MSAHVLRQVSFCAEGHFVPRTRINGTGVLQICLPSRTWAFIIFSFTRSRSSAAVCFTIFRRLIASRKRFCKVWLLLVFALMKFPKQHVLSKKFSAFLTRPCNNVLVPASQ